MPPQKDLFTMNDTEVVTQKLRTQGFKGQDLKAALQVTRKQRGMMKMVADAERKKVKRQSPSTQKTSSQQQGLKGAALSDTQRVAVQRVAALISSKKLRATKVGKQRVTSYSKAPGSTRRRKASTFLDLYKAQLKEKGYYVSTAKIGLKKPKAATTTGTKAKSLSAALRKDTMRIKKLIKDGTIAAAQQQGKKVTTYTEASGADRVAKAKKFVALHKQRVKAKGLKTGVGSVGLKKKARKSAKKLSISKRYQAITSQSKEPYYISKGRTYKVGGGATGPGIIRKVRGQTAVPFKKLSAPERKAVAQFLATPQGKRLRGPKARRKVVVQQLIAVNIPKSEIAKAQKQQSKKK
jgi:hypothetical protein